MSQRDLHQYHALRLVLEGRLTGAQAAASLGLSLRQIWRLVAWLRREGCRAVVHRNRGRASGRHLPTVKSLSLEGFEQVVEKGLAQSVEPLSRDTPQAGRTLKDPLVDQAEFNPVTLESGDLTYAFEGR